MVDRESVKQAIIRAVWDAELTSASIKSVRGDVERVLGMEPGELKRDEWKQFSKALIVEKFDERHAGKSAPLPPATEDKPQKLDVFNKPENQVTEAAEEEKSGDESSELSELVDDEPAKPPPKKRVKTSPKPKPQAKSQAKSQTQTKAKAQPKSKPGDAKKIDELKSQLFQCGIRKRWANILNPMDSDGERVKYLKGQLEEIGMTGKFSAAKAKKIKEEREYAQEMADLAKEAGDFQETRRGARSRRTKAAPIPAQPGSDDSSEDEDNDEEDTNNSNDEDEFDNDEEGEEEEEKETTKPKKRVIVEDSDEE